jgi:hypothetical protein
MPLAFSAHLAALRNFAALSYPGVDASDRPKSLILRGATLTRRASPIELPALAARTCIVARLEYHSAGPQPHGRVALLLSE